VRFLADRAIRTWYKPVKMLGKSQADNRHYPVKSARNVTESPQEAGAKLYDF